MDARGGNVCCCPCGSCCCCCCCAWLWHRRHTDALPAPRLSMLPAKLPAQLAQPGAVAAAASRPPPVRPASAASRHATRCCRSEASTSFTALSAISDLIFERLSRSLARSEARAEAAAVEGPCLHGASSSSPLLLMLVLSAEPEASYGSARCPAAAADRMLLPPLPMPPAEGVRVLAGAYWGPAASGADWMWDLTAFSSCLRCRQMSGSWAWARGSGWSCCSCCCAGAAPSPGSASSRALAAGAAVLGGPGRRAERCRPSCCGGSLPLTAAAGASWEAGSTLNKSSEGLMAPAAVGPSMLMRRSSAADPHAGLLPAHGCCGMGQPTLRLVWFVMASEAT